jgi:hypothetical protein
MPHYKDGTKAELLDEVIAPHWKGHHESGVVVDIIEGASSCNLQVQVSRVLEFYGWDGGAQKNVLKHRLPGTQITTVNAHDVERADLHVKRVREEKAAAPSS